MLLRNKVGQLAIKYDHQKSSENIFSSPNEIVPFLISQFDPQSFVDVGCGLGAFLSVFLSLGINQIKGLDGSWVDTAKLFIPKENFMVCNLEERVYLNQKYDLVICLEVAEHLAETASDILVDNLIALGDCIVFSAALKGQGGQNHINEQFMNYWVEKFAIKGFIFQDIFRNHFWNNKKVDWCYKQNMFLVTRATEGASIQYINTYIHPELYENLLLKKISIIRYWKGGPHFGFI